MWLSYFSAMLWKIFTMVLKLKGVLGPAGYATTEIQLFFQVLLPLYAPSYLLKAARDNTISKLSQVRTAAVLSWPGRNLTWVLPLHFREPEVVFIVWEVQNHTERFSLTRGQQNVSALGSFFPLISLYVVKGTFVPAFCVLQFVNLFWFFYYSFFFNQANWCMKEFCQCVWITESLCQVTLCLFPLSSRKKPCPALRKVK